MSASELCIVCMTCCTAQPLRVQTSANVVETAIMHVMEATACTSELRIAAMHEVNPLHMFMFSSRGRLLNMNHAAMEGQPD